MQSTQLPTKKASSLANVKDKSYDYLIIGGGTSGCLLASRLAAESSPKASVLLVEAGGDDAEDVDNLVPGLTKGKYGSPEGNWGYETVPQKALGGRKIPYPRGRGWVDVRRTIGSRGSAVRNVTGTSGRNGLGIRGGDCPVGEEKYATAALGIHGQGGPIAVGYGKVWQPLVKHCLKGAEQAGHRVNADVNSGEPEGFSVAQFNVDNGIRTTSAGAFLGPDARSRLDNLTLVTRVLCSQVLFDGHKKAIGAELISAQDDGSEPVHVQAGREVILCAGAFASPQILLLSGVGPADHLATLKIPCVQNIPAVGDNIQDHTALGCEFIIDPAIPGHNQLLNDGTALDAAQKEYQQTKTGPLAYFGASAAVSFPRLPRLFSTPEFQSLPEATKTYLQTPNRPSTEIWMHGGPLFYTGPCPPDASVLVLEGLSQNNLSKGTLRLASADPRHLPLIDPMYYSHPYDMKIAVATLLEIIKIAESPAISSIVRKVLYGPRSPRDGAQLAAVHDEGELKRFVEENVTQGFHSMSTCIMGKNDEENKVVGSDFKVVGLKGLRVADMSVCPILTTNHTQINAYLIGERCAELVLGE